MSSKKFGLAAAAFIVVASLLVGGIVGTPARQVFSSGVDTGQAASIEQAYNEAVATVAANYADEIDYEKANQAAIQGMLYALDPHSNFFTQAEYTRLLQDQDSRYVGIGVTITRHRDGVYIQSLFDGAPAVRAGLHYGDRIDEVDGKDAREWSITQVSTAVRGERGKPVTLKLNRAGANAPLYRTINRDSVPLPTVSATYMMRPGTGYVALSRGFNHTTAEELRAALRALEREGMRQLVLDLRNNPGGLLDQSISVASQFVGRGQTVVSVRGRDERQSKVYKNIGTDPVDHPLVVLINRGSASASEIVAGAVQDHGRGLVIGETSFGKGLVQRVFPLPFGAGLTLTTAKYYTPYGRLIQRDYSNGSLYDYYARQDATSGTTTPTTVPTQPAVPGVAPLPVPIPQPTPAGPAIKTAAGRVFYGGGGITPDVEVKSLEITSPTRARIYESAFRFARELAAGRVAGLESMRVDEPDFRHTLRPTDYVVTDRVVEAFRNFVRREPPTGLTLSQINADLDYVKLRIRDELVIHAYGGDAGTRVLIESDPQLLRALDALPDAKQLAESVSRAPVLN
ncbi:MAG: S41 family peptidase [Acidobacteriota bacterium]|nr:S41 family peptidase [Acidobacteriota bacterium]